MTMRLYISQEHVSVCLFVSISWVCPWPGGIFCGDNIFIDRFCSVLFGFDLSLGWLGSFFKSRFCSVEKLAAFGGESGKR